MTLARAAILSALGILALSDSMQGAESPPQTAGPYQVTLLLPSAGLFAGEESEIEFRVVEPRQVAADGASAPLLWARIRAEIDMPSMPGMPRFDELAHREGIPGVYGVHPTFPHGGDYRLCLAVLPRPVQLIGEPVVPFAFEFPLTVLDAAASPKPEARRVRPYLLEVIPTPSHPVAGQMVDLELRVRHANSLDLREVTDFELIHERLMHLFLVRSDLTHFAHEHPEASGPGVFRVPFRFSSAGSYRIFADVAPRAAGAQVLSAAIDVAGARIEDSRGPVPLLESPTLTVEAGEIHIELELPAEGIPAGRTITVVAVLSDRKGRAIRNLEPWLGSMGHLLLVHQDAATFAHAHPDEREPSVGRDGRIPFLVRLPKPGFYRGWLQFQRNGRITTAEFTLKGDGSRPPS